MTLPSPKKIKRETKKTKKTKRVWIHGASLGDINALKSLIYELSVHKLELTLSAITSSGKTQIHQRYISQDHPNLHTHPAPIWSPLHAQRAWSKVQPDLLILELLEIWPLWIKTWSRRGVPVVVVDGRISPRTLKARFLLKSSFERLDLFLAQTALDAERAVYMGTPPARVIVCGNAKYDQPPSPKKLLEKGEPSKRGEEASRQSHPLSSPLSSLPPPLLLRFI